MIHRYRQGGGELVVMVLPDLRHLAGEIADVGLDRIAGNAKAGGIGRCLWGQRARDQMADRL